LPASWQVLLLYSNGTVVAEGNVAAIAPSAIPTPYATPGFSSPEYQSAALTGPLTAASTVSVVLGNQALYCNGFPQVGSFTTQ
jgi:hypothetical protein